MHYEKLQDGTVKCIEDEIPFEVPEGWAWARVSSVVQIYLGLTHTPDYVNKGVPFYSVKDISSGGLDTSNPKYISEEEFDNFPSGAKPQIGDILFGRVGTLGKPTVVEIEEPFGIFVSLGFFRKIYEDFSSEYIMEWMDSSLFWTQVSVNVKGAVLTNLNTGWLSRFLMPIPPIREQVKISDYVKVLLAKTNFISTTEEELINLVTVSKSKILDLAIRGKLVPQDPNDEPASVLLERIRAEKEELIKQGKIKRDKKESIIFRGDDNSYYLRTESKAIEITNELPYEIPDSWEWARIGDILQVNPRNKIEDLVEVSFIPMSLIDDGFSGKHTSEERVWRKVKSGFTHFMEGDIGIAKITPCFENRKSVVFRNLKNGYGAGTTELHILRPYASTILPDYVLAYVKSSIFIGKGKQKFTGAVGQQRIGKDYLENSYFPIPPLAEQERIVGQISTVYKQLNMISEALI